MAENDFFERKSFEMPDLSSRQIRELVTRIAIVALVMVVGFGFYMSYFTVAAYEKAVVLRFGVPQDSVRGPGLHFKIPLADKAVKVRIDEHSLALPYALTAAGRGSRMQRTRASLPEPLILTGDLYAGVVEWNVVWRVVDPERFLFSIAAEDVEKTIQAVARSAMNRVVGDYSADELLTGKRGEIGQAARKEMQETLDDYESGIRIVAVQMQRVTPPERVKPAFDAVNESIQERDQFVNEARAERNKLIPQAEATKDRLIREAEGYAARRRAETEGEIVALLAKFDAYRQAPEVTRQRLYLDAMEEVLLKSGPKTILDADLQGLLPLLDLTKSRSDRGN